MAKITFKARREAFGFKREGQKKTIKINGDKKEVNQLSGGKKLNPISKIVRNRERTKTQAKIRFQKAEPLIEIFNEILKSEPKVLGYHQNIKYWIHLVEKNHNIDFEKRFNKQVFLRTIKYCAKANKKVTELTPKEIREEIIWPMYGKKKPKS